MALTIPAFRLFSKVPKPLLAVLVGVTASPFSSVCTNGLGMITFGVSWPLTAFDLLLFFLFKFTPTAIAEMQARVNAKGY